MVGKIARVVKDKGFGFIEAEGYEDIFFHMSSIRHGDFKLLMVGDKVDFDCNETNKGLRAENVRVL